MCAAIVTGKMGYLQKWDQFFNEKKYLINSYQNLRSLPLTLKLTHFQLWNVDTRLCVISVIQGVVKFLNP